MTTLARFTVFCDGRHPGQAGPDDGELRCGAWCGQENTKQEARLLARREGWQVQASSARDLCPRCAREEKRHAQA